MTAGYLAYNGRATVPANGEDTMRTTQPVEGTIRIGVDSFAIVEPVESRTIRSRSSGVVTYVAPVGTTVSEGAEVVRFDAQDLESRLRRAELDLADARISYERTARALARAGQELSDTRRLFEAGVATGEQLVSREESLYQAEYAEQSASISLQRRMLDYESAEAEFEARVLRAPMSGVVTQAAVARGDSVGTNAELLTIADASRVRLVADIDEYDIGRIAVDMRAQARIDALEWAQAGLGTFNGVVDAVSPSARIVSNISVFTVSARFNNAEGYLRPGMTADLTILTAADSGLLVPAGTVSTVRDRTYVDILLEDGTVEPRRVSVGLSDGVHTVVHEGLETHDEVVLPDLGAIDVLNAAPAQPPEPGQSLIPISVPGASTTGSTSGGGGGGGGGRQ